MRACRCPLLGLRVGKAEAKRLQLSARDGAKLLVAYMVIKYGLRLFVKANKTVMSLRPRPVAAPPTNGSRLAHVLSVGMHGMPPQPALGVSFPPTFYAELQAKTSLFEWINGVIGTGKSDKFWILISVPVAKAEKLKEFKYYFMDRSYTTNPLDPYRFDEYVYFMWTTSGLNLDQVNDFTQYLNSGKYTYEFIAGDHDKATGNWTWTFVGGPMVKDVAVGPYSDRMPPPGTRSQRAPAPTPRNPPSKPHHKGGGSKDHHKGGSKDHGKGKQGGGRGGKK